jgi:hypothetical protein
LRALDYVKIKLLIYRFLVEMGGMEVGVGIYGVKEGMG